MKLTKQDILNIDSYLKKKGIKFTDVRFELIDHLVSEYDSLENYPDLDSFLRKRTAWCINVAEKKAKNMHWGYQKDLWKQVWKFLKSPWFYVIVAVLAFGVSELISRLEPKTFQTTLGSIFIGLIVVQFSYFFISRFKSKQKLKLLSSDYLFNIFSLPNLFLYLISLIDEVLLNHPIVFSLYIGTGILINVTALYVVVQKQKVIAKEYNFLKTYFV